MATFLDDKDRADFLGLLDEFVEKERLPVKSRPEWSAAEPWVVQTKKAESPAA